MKTELEKYLEQNRNRLDVEEFDDSRLWEGIRVELHQSKRSLPVQLLRISALAVILIAIGYIALQMNRQNKLEKAQLFEISKMLGEHEQNYIERVNLYLQEIENLEMKENEVISDLLEELTFLDTLYDEAFRDLNKLGYKEQVVNIIFDTYEKKIRILENIIVESQKMEINENREQKIIL
jgi:hypothetical protein